MSPKAIKMNNFFSKNKVFLLGLLSAIAVVLQQYNTPNPDYKAIGLACGLAVLSYIANAWRGQGVTILGIVGIMAGVFVNSYHAGEHISWTAMIGSFVAAILAAVAPPPKPKTYEEDPNIEAAKQ